MSFVIYLTNANNKSKNRIYWFLVKFKPITYDVLITELYIIANRFDIKKLHEKRY